jgi:hypothetical protein
MSLPTVNARADGARQRRRVLVVVHAHIAQWLPVGSADVRGHAGVDPGSASAGRRDSGLDVGVHQPAGEDPLAVAHRTHDA